MWPFRKNKPVEPVNIREVAQGAVNPNAISSMIQNFHTDFREVYPTGVHCSSMCAVGPLQSMVGHGINQGHLVSKEELETALEHMNFLIQAWEGSFSNVHRNDVSSLEEARKFLDDNY